MKHRQIIFFVLAGGISAIIEIGSFKIFSVSIPQIFSKESNFHGVNFPLSNLFSTTCGIVTNYFLSIWFVFERGKHSKKREFLYFMILSFFSTLLSLLFFQIFYKYIFKMHLDLPFFTLSSEILSKIAAIVVVSILNFSLKKKIVFNG
jgi:putative flippase GtrA